MALSKDSGRRHFSTTMISDLYEELIKYSKDTGIPISKILDRAVEAYLNNHNSFNPNNKKEPSDNNG